MTDIGGDPYHEYLYCLDCNTKLSTVTERDGRTAIVITSKNGTEVAIFRAELICSICGETRKFYSELISAVRLGIVGR